MDAEIEIEGNLYRVGRLNAFKQFHVVRRLAPALFALGEVGSNPKNLQDDISALAAMGPVAEAVSKLSDADSEYVLNTCLLVCKRQAEGGVWAPVKVQGAVNLQFDDIKLPTMMRLVFETIKENLGNFFPVPPAQN